MANSIPIGCRFRPTEEELISLLWPKITNQLQETDDVKEMTLNGEGASPWRVFGDDNAIHWQIFDENEKKASTKEMVYVFTKLTKLNDKRTARTAGSGTWEGETKKTPVENSLQQDASSSYVGNYWFASNSEGMMENSELTSTLGSGTSINQVKILTICSNLLKYNPVNKHLRFLLSLVIGWYIKQVK